MDASVCVRVEQSMPTDRHADVVIVGGGPAGSTCAKFLIQQGLRVTVMDKAQFPRDKTCAGWITPEVVKELSLDLERYRQGRVLQTITGFRTGIIGAKKAIEVNYNHAVSYGILRREFDDYLLKNCGADLLLGEPITKLSRQGKIWLINGRLHSPLLVGAGGHFCPVARHLGAKLGRREPIITAKEIEFVLESRPFQHCKAQGEIPELYFCADLSGYGWVFRKGPVVNIGLGRDRSKGLGQHLNNFIRFLQNQKRIPQDLPSRYKGHAYILYGKSLRQATADAAMLIGDALGLAYAQSGEGIRPAIESAIFAAQTISTKRGHYSKDDLQNYASLITQRFGDTQSVDHSRNWLSLNLKPLLGRWLIKRRWFAKNIVMDRWFLHRHEPPVYSPTTTGKRPETAVITVE